MLGRLKLSIDESEELQRAVKEIVTKQGLHEDTLLKDASDDACKV